MNYISVYEQHFKKMDAPNHFANILATIYRSELVLYSQRTVGSPLSSHIKTISVAFIGAEI